MSKRQYNSNDKKSQGFLAIENNLLFSKDLYNLSPHSIKIYLALRRYTDYNLSPVDIPYSKIANDSVYMIRNSIAELEYNGFIRITPTQGGANIYNFPLEYRIRFGRKLEPVLISTPPKNFCTPPHDLGGVPRTLSAPLRSLERFQNRLNTESERPLNSRINNKKKSKTSLSSVYRAKNVPTNFIYPKKDGDKNMKPLGKRLERIHRDLVAIVNGNPRWSADAIWELLNVYANSKAAWKRFYAEALIIDSRKRGNPAAFVIQGLDNVDSYPWIKDLASNMAAEEKKGDRIDEFYKIQNKRLDSLFIKLKEKRLDKYAGMSLSKLYTEKLKKDVDDSAELD